MGIVTRKLQCQVPIRRKKCRKFTPKKLQAENLCTQQQKPKKSFGFEIGIKFCVFFIPILHFCKQFLLGILVLLQNVALFAILKLNADETAHKNEENIFRNGSQSFKFCILCLISYVTLQWPGRAKLLKSFYPNVPYIHLRFLPPPSSRATGGEIITL